MELIRLSDLSRFAEAQLSADAAPTPVQLHQLHRAMIALAETCIKLGQAQTAADALAFLLLQSDVNAIAFDRAQDLFAELESSICPRVILDARDFAAGMDLKTMLEYLLDVGPRERI